MRMVRLSGILTYAAAESSLRGETGTVGLEETVEKHSGRRRYPMKVSDPTELTVTGQGVRRTPCADLNRIR